MLTTVTEGGELSSRPMSNNRDVKYDGDSWFFAYDDARFIQDIQTTDQVGLPDPRGQSLSIHDLYMESRPAGGNPGRFGRLNTGLFVILSQYMCF